MEGPASTEATRNGGARRPEAHGEIEYDASVSGSDLLIVGAGPAGLATAIAAHKAGLDYAVSKGALVESIFRFPRQITFSPLPTSSRSAAYPSSHPTRNPPRGRPPSVPEEVADTYDLRLELGCAVTRLERKAGPSPGSRCAPPRGVAPRGSRHVVLATGYYDNPNRLGVPGEDLPHVSALLDRGARLLPPTRGRRRWQERPPSPRSSSTARPVTLVHHRPPPGRRDQVLDQARHRESDGRGRSRRDSRRRSVRIEPERVHVKGPGGEGALPADAVFLLTGYHPHMSLLREAGVAVDPSTLKPELDLETLETKVARPVRGGRRGLGARDEPHLHRERPFPRRGHRDRDPGSGPGGEPPPLGPGP